MIPSSYTNEYPVKFETQGSNNNTNWDKIYENDSIPGVIAYTRTIASYVGGVSLLTSGQPTQRVVIANWLTGEHIGTVIPDQYGNWFYSTDYGIDVLVTHIGPAGYKPESDGPITPYLW